MDQVKCPYPVCRLFLNELKQTDVIAQVTEDNNLCEAIITCCREKSMTRTRSAILPYHLHGI
ncbi:hypothetical protein SAMN05216228_10509 [Rhizobium tibeticum]|uniref:Uncharacterized protein n=1 Tax=Rhizobium tibeticum TaxID=501024 RepID=A0A1H8VZN3_9HYPH|nr:hypothetical protein RTCCBAU85039_6297 [Rhizobium tibeticum]SEP20859.1 hypothetical protein SAMN05216228_10509 [Rhizobium tibeticum]